ncbi:hypothetical protein EYF80_020068 [Liparis tanakae]|uniref:Uncharacterized protein n=1 Tax=Liparis tanakae TaxID=230148 RepID=A0A4Z2HXE7_9TELE|nr:hypothetical protein EYF80_020068 [Liparis tanakae]
MNYTVNIPLVHYVSSGEHQGVPPLILKLTKASSLKEELEGGASQQRGRGLKSVREGPHSREGGASQQRGRGLMVNDRTLSMPLIGWSRSECLTWAGV